MLVVYLQKDPKQADAFSEREYELRFWTQRRIKRKGVGKEPIHDEEEMFRIDIRNSMPEAAIMRSQPTLYAEDWNVPIRNALELSNVDGIAIVQKAQIAQTLRRVGYTRNAVAMLTTQSATQLHMKGYPCKEMHIRIQTQQDDEIKEFFVRQYLIQLGFGREVAPRSTGELVDFPQTMTKMVVKAPSFLGWFEESMKGSTFTNIISEYINLQAIESLQVRENGSATFQAHTSVVKELLRNSGKNGLFFKVHKSFEHQYPCEILWLPETMLYEEALALSNNDTCNGLIVKNAKVQPRFAIRFSSTQELSAFARTNALPDNSDKGRWRIEGIDSTIGSAGIITFLESKGWNVDELLYCGARHGVYTASQVGQIGPMHYKLPGNVTQQIRFKALNSVAKKAHSDASKASRTSGSAASTAAPTTEGQKKTEYLRALKTIDLTATPASPRVKTAADKRNAQGLGHTGTTPPSKQPERSV